MRKEHEMKRFYLQEDFTRIRRPVLAEGYGAEFSAAIACEQRWCCRTCYHNLLLKTTVWQE